MAADNITSYIIATAIVVFAVVYYLRKPGCSRSILPPLPGPTCLPIVGCLFSLNMRRLHLSFCDLGKQYGDVFTVTILHHKFVILNSIDAIREAFHDERYAQIFAARPHTYFYNNNPTSALVQGYNEEYRKQRKMAFKLLHFYGEGRGNTENVVTEELRCVVETVKATNGKPMDLIAEVITPSLINIINILLKGERWPYNDKRMETIITFTSDSDRLTSPDIEEVLNHFPFLRHFPFGPGKVWRRLQHANKAFLDLHFNQVKASYKENISRGMTDVMLTKQRENEKESGIRWPSDMTIMGMTADFMRAGIVTTIASLSTFILQMVYRPDIFRKIQEEVDTVIGHERPPRFADMKMMPYTQATILENLRYNSHARLVIRIPTEDVVFRGHFIPKDTMFVGNTWRAHHDATIWKNPDEFHPERFLDESGNLRHQDDPMFKSYLPFGIGKRMCIGMTFAKNRMFLYVTTLAQNFNFLSDDPETLPPLDPTKHAPTLIRCSRPYQVCAVIRNAK